MYDFVHVGALVQSDDGRLYGALKTWLANPDLAKHAGESGQRLVQERADADKVQFAMIKALL